MKKMGDLADSRRNMKIDFRPRAVMRIMRLELLIFFAGISMCAIMPFYFLKIRGYKEKYLEEYSLKQKEQSLAQQEEEEKQEIKHLRRNFD